MFRLPPIEVGPEMNLPRTEEIKQLIILLESVYNLIFKFRYPKYC